MKSQNSMLNTSLSSIETPSTKITAPKSTLTKVSIDLKGDEYLFSILGIREELEILKSKYPAALKDYRMSPTDHMMIVYLDKSST